jgi:hypothetical protein
MRIVPGTSGTRVPTRPTSIKTSVRAHHRASTVFVVAETNRNVERESPLIYAESASEIELPSGFGLEKDTRAANTANDSGIRKSRKP